MRKRRSGLNLCKRCVHSKLRPEDIILPCRTGALSTGQNWLLTWHSEIQHTELSVKYHGHIWNNYFEKTVSVALHSYFLHFYRLCSFAGIYIINLFRLYWCVRPIVYKNNYLSTYLGDNVIKVIKAILNFYKLAVRSLHCFSRLSGPNITKVWETLQS